MQISDFYWSPGLHWSPKTRSPLHLFPHFIYLMSETDSMDVDSEYELPGGNDFEDITALLPHAAKGKSCWSTKISVPSYVAFLQIWLQMKSYWRMDSLWWMLWAHLKWAIPFVTQIISWWARADRRTANGQWYDTRRGQETTIRFYRSSSPGGVVLDYG